MWLNKIDFGWPNAEIGQKMVMGALLFLALYYDAYKCMAMQEYLSTYMSAKINDIIT